MPRYNKRMMPRFCFAVFAFLLMLVPSPAFAAPPPLAVASADALKAIAPADTVVEILSSDAAALWLPEPFAPPVYHVDPRYKNRTTRAVYVYQQAVTGEKMIRRATVHFEPDDRDAAIKTARIVARLLRLHRERWGRDAQFPRGATEANVWLVPTTPATETVGGETRDADVYIFAPSAIKTVIELPRTVAHEWGHLTLPAARGYAAPENDAAGYLGERLYLHWMTFPLRSDPPEAYPKDPETLNALVAYADKQSLPLMARFIESGINSPLLRGDSAEAMDYYIGMVLACDEAFLRTGSKSLNGAILWGVTGETAADYVRSAEREMAKQTLPGIVINKLPAFVPLAKGVYTIETPNGAGVLTFAGAETRTVTLPTGTLRVTKPGWYRVSSKPDVGHFKLTRTPNIMPKAVK